MSNSVLLFESRHVEVVRQVGDLCVSTVIRRDFGKKL